MTQIRQLGHVVLFVRDPMASADWYCDVLGMEAVVRDDLIPAAFLSFGRRDHGISYGVYFRDPDGHHLEVFYQRIPDGTEAKTAFSKMGAIAKAIDITKVST